jgi:hypothetical protein
MFVISVSAASAACVRTRDPRRQSQLRSKGYGLIAQGFLVHRELSFVVSGQFDYPPEMTAGLVANRLGENLRFDTHGPFDRAAREQSCADRARLRG